MTTTHEDDAYDVREFTVGAGQRAPERPEEMSEEQVRFLAKMMLDEMMEFTATVEEPGAAKDKLCKFIDESKDIALPAYESMENGVVQRIADQADALVDAYYYSLNAAARHGVNLSQLFAVVHEANMNKRDPATGKFLRREDGKIIKPPGWQPPNVEAEIARQLEQGGFNEVATESKPDAKRTDADMVCEFTSGAGSTIPSRPEVFSSEAVFFLAKMMLDEIMEFMATVLPPAEAKEALKTFIRESKDIAKTQQSDRVQLIADQADALVDSYYYSLNAAALHGVNLSSLFAVVHEANMNKRDPATGEFLRREDGKIIKPPGWQPPNVEAEIARQLEHGSFPRALELETSMPTTVA
ncbi:Hypothetical Protein FCC1311_072772 [Hondaea fermentalgiana]|uniref:Uncharacterized protein n=1 Tax=Hondaea fermentalgiana TaxID=2315210 RepID=A0A2R5GJI9_9STRA|nr:Hypothetical Protein FCC1311_072772 [Hondaea fermentalgiana]|eukprot:GBG31056.1 Hypothetical Protein FCC1311_072772 [Hondaea fermentalgiana]